MGKHGAPLLHVPTRSLTSLVAERKFDDAAHAVHVHCLRQGNIIRQLQVLLVLEVSFGVVRMHVRVFVFVRARVFVFCFLFCARSRVCMFLRACICACMYVCVFTFVSMRARALINDFFFAILEYFFPRPPEKLLPGKVPT